VELMSTDSSFSGLKWWKDLLIRQATKL